MAVSQQSPGVQFQEKNASGIVPGASTSVGGFAGQFNWGPISQPMLIDNEETLTTVFGKPSNSTAVPFFSVSNFLAYSSAAWVSRVANTTSTGDAAAQNATNAPTSATYDFIGTQYDAATYTSFGHLIRNYSEYEALTSGTEVFAARYAGSLGNGLTISIADGGTYANWEHKDKFPVILNTNRELLHVIVIDTLGKFSGTVGGVLEKYTSVSKASNALSYQGTSNYYKSVIAAKSQYIYSISHPAGTANWGGNVGTAFDFLTDTAGAPYDHLYTLVGGTDGDAVTSAEILGGYDLLTNSELYDISLYFTGKADKTLSKGIKDKVESRMDSVVFVTISNPTDGSMIIGTSSSKLTDAATWKSDFGNSTYAVIDSGYKYQYDKYNDVYRWIPLNADIAGLCAKVDRTHDTWMSPAGYTKGQIKGAVKLSWNPSKAERDVLYPLSINPVITEVGEGTLLLGDKTATTEPSAFDRINVRRLFLTLEKSISKAAKYRLFDQNDAITRSLWKSQVEPKLRDAQGRRGIEEFRVICDETNNTPAVRAANEFRGKILIKPLYSINFITLTFTAVGPDVTFEVAAGV